MAKISAYSSISVVDYSDIGQLNFYLTSNQPTSVIYNPNLNIYVPDWSNSILQITPMISYNGRVISLSDNTLTISYKRKDGDGADSSLTNGEIVENGVLKVNQNKLPDTVSGLLTYVCTVTYTDPTAKIPLVAESSLSYSLINLATETKSATINGESTFLYSAGRTVIGTGSITLTALTTNVSVVRWQYKNILGEFIDFPLTYNEAINTNNLIVKDTERDIWINEKLCVIKLVTDDPSIYDIFQINKLYDGAAGDTTLAAVLSNENHILPIDSEGNIKSMNGSSTTIHIYDGGFDVTDQWNISATTGDGLTGTFDNSSKTFTPTSLTQDSSYVDFTCTRTGYSNLQKRYTISKQYQGSDGVNAIFHEVVSNTFVLTKNNDNVFNPSTVTFTAYEQNGDSLKTQYLGRFVVSESYNGTDFIDKYRSSEDESSLVYTPNDSDIVSIRCTLYQSGGITTELDSQTIGITRDGLVGEDGLNLGLGNYSDVIPCTHDGLVIGSKDINIPFYAYQGITKVPVTAVVSNIPTGMSIVANISGTSTSDGNIILRIDAESPLGNQDSLSGDITITLTSNETSVGFKYGWIKNRQAIDGKSPIILQLYSENGGTVEKGRSTTIKLMMYSGTTHINPDSVEWAAFSNGDYERIKGETGNEIIITDDIVADEMWLRCKATFNDSDYYAYYTIDDITDDIESYTFATIEQFKNGEGCGAVYTRCYRKRVEIDPIKTTVFSDLPPTNPQSGDYYYFLDRINKECILKRYNGSLWVDSPDEDELIYNYYRIDSQGVALDTETPWKTQRCIYVDPSIINERMQFICEVAEDD